MSHFPLSDPPRSNYYKQCNSIRSLYLSALQVVPGSINRLHEVAKDLQDKGLPP